MFEYHVIVLLSNPDTSCNIQVGQYHTVSLPHKAKALLIFDRHPSNFCHGTHAYNKHFAAIADKLSCF